MTRFEIVFVRVIFSLAVIAMAVGVATYVGWLPK
jgi:hypothetical protein